MFSQSPVQNEDLNIYTWLYVIWHCGGKKNKGLIDKRCIGSKTLINCSILFIGSWRNMRKSGPRNSYPPTGNSTNVHKEIQTYSTISIVINYFPLLTQRVNHLHFSHKTFRQYFPEIRFLYSVSIFASELRRHFEGPFLRYCMMRNWEELLSMSVSEH